jgi:hypothetical protein
MPDFSSTHSTTAFPGGLWYRPIKGLEYQQVVLARVNAASSPPGVAELKATDSARYEREVKRHDHCSSSPRPGRGTAS